MIKSINSPVNFDDLGKRVLEMIKVFNESNGTTKPSDPNPYQCLEETIPGKVGRQ